MDELFAEADRQLKVCNSCRYCAGYCPVWPALELRPNLTEGDITHLGNLCHDCRDCFTACMYTPPHVFDLNPPKVFAQVRERTYEEYARPQWFAPIARSRHFWWVAPIVASLVLVGLSVTTRGTGVFVGRHDSSPYALLDHVTLVILMSLPAVWGVVMICWAAWDYWRDINDGRLRGLFDVRAWLTTFSLAARLKHQSGGEEGCNYETDAPSRSRKVSHQLIMYGFLLTFLSTISAAFIQSVLGIYPPYPYLSVPSVLGTVGGVMAVIGCVWAWRLKTRSNKVMTSATMLRSDMAFLGVCFLLQFSGLLTTAFRSTTLFGVLLVFHLAVVAVAFLVAPYTKFVHWIFRLLSVQKDNLETAADSRATPESPSVAAAPSGGPAPKR